jgi:hypothetical protein
MMGDIITWETVLFDVVAAAVIFLLSRAALWLMRSWDGGVARLANAYLAAWVLCCLAYIYPVGVWLDAIDFGVLAGIWFGVDMARGKGKRVAPARDSLHDTFD